MISRAAADCWVAILIFGFCLLVFGLGFRYVVSGDTVPNELLPLTLIYDRDFDFDEFVSDRSDLPYWFRDVDGRIVSMYPVLPGLLNLPAHLVAYAWGMDLEESRFQLATVTALLVSAGSVAFMYLCLASICAERQKALLFALTYAFATCVWSVTSRSLLQHGPSLLFLSIALFLLFHPNRSFLPQAGFHLGWAVVARPSNGLIALPLAVYVWRHHRARFVRFAAWAAGPALFLAWYSQTYWGSWWALGQGHGAAGFGANWGKGLAGVLFSPARGLFVFSPVLLFGFAYLARSIFYEGEAAIHRYLAISFLALVLLYASWGMWWGGHSFGYRLLIESTPILVIFLALAWERWIATRPRLRLLFFGSLAASVYFHFLGAFYFPCGFNYSPDNIDSNPQRLWELRDTQLARCARKSLARLPLP